MPSPCEEEEPINLGQCRASEDNNENVEVQGESTTDEGGYQLARQRKEKYKTVS